MTTFARARLVLPEGVREDGWIRWSGHRIDGLGSGTPPADDEIVDLDGAWVLPGFIDVHCHGGGGGEFVSGDPDSARRAVSFHRRHGTTTILLSTVTAPVPELVTALRNHRRLVEEDRRPDGSVGTVAGVHLEGPFLAEAACGAQDPRWMIDPDPDAVTGLLEAGADALRMVTLAPERPGAVEAIRRLVVAGVLAAVGHTAASHDEVTTAIGAGATVATHLFNAMSPLHHREPGAVGALLDDDRVTAELIVDGHHLDPTAVRVAVRAKGAGRCCLITDAIAAAGMDGTDAELGGRRVRVRDGAVRLVGTGALAGSLLTMDVAVRNALRMGIPIESVVEMASTTPARLLGLNDTRGSLEVGKHADLVVLDEDHRIRTVIVAGEPVDGAAG